MQGITNNKTQEGKILALLLAARGGWVSLPEIMALGIAQFSARIWALRHRSGLKIENKTQRVKGVKHSWYRLVVGVPAKNLASTPNGSTQAMFSEPLVARMD